MTSTSNERRAQRTAGHMQRLVERDLMSSIAARKECSHNCFCQKQIWSLVRAKFRLGSISLVKSTAISFGGMVVECLEVGVFETLLFISIFLLCFELVCGWLQTKDVVYLLASTKRSEVVLKYVCTLIPKLPKLIVPTTLWSYQQTLASYQQT